MDGYSVPIPRLEASSVCPLKKLLSEMPHQIMMFLDIHSIYSTIEAFPEMRSALNDDILWKNLISRDFYPCKRIWDILNCSNGPMIDLYCQVMCQRKIMLMQLTKENKEMEESNNLLVVFSLLSSL